MSSAVPSVPRRFFPLGAPFHFARGRLGLALLGALLLALCARPARANQPGGGSAGPGVTLQTAGAIATLANGVVTVKIDTPNAKVISLVYKGREFISQGQRGHVLSYFSFNADPQLFPNHCRVEAAVNTPEMIDLVCRHVYDPARDPYPVDMDLHFVLRRGATGLYMYAVLNHPAAYGDLRCFLFRWVCWMPLDPADTDRYLFEKLFVDPLRNREMATAYDEARSSATGIKEINLYATGKRKGLYNCKYEFNTEYAKTPCWGFASDVNKAGVWCIPASTEYFNNGPTQQDVSSAAGLMHIILQHTHYGASDINIKQGTAWKKVYGPWLFYANAAPTAEACWADAKAQAGAESRAWPYTWVKEPAYQAAGRGGVQGRFVIHDPLNKEVSAAGAWIGLAKPETAGDPLSNWQFQSDAYQYWTRAGADGAFNIPAARPGQYTLYAFANGAVGEFSKTGVTVAGREVTRLGDLTWTIQHPGKSIAWEIGVPNRTAEEFAHGASDYWTPYLFTQFDRQFPNPIDYDAAQKNWSTALNYAQCGYGAALKPWPWNIHFELANLPDDPHAAATLTIAWASAHRAKLQVFVNDPALSKPAARLAPSLNDGNALLRESNHAKYGVTDVAIPCSMLKRGKNTLTLLLTPAKGPAPHVMYDYIRFEMPNANAVN